MIGLAAAWNIAKSIMGLAVPVPVVILVAAYGWFAIDKASAVRVAVNKAVVEIVAGAELKAAKEEAANATLLAKIAADQAKDALDKALALAAANKTYQEKFAADALKKEALQNELTRIENDPIDGNCRVSGPVFERLYNRK